WYYTPESTRLSQCVRSGPGIFRIFFAFPPARHLPAMLRNARRAGREPLRRGRRGRKAKSVNPLRGN
ncbi:MAG: hypothetical protein KKI12_14535, partial [Proteobacteria bacterium]|nr:hypothetical protein [Pseudomonadota bacterium]